MEKQEINVNVDIDNGEDFFAHEATISYNPLQFIFDFKSMTPRSDQRQQQNGQVILRLKHNVVMVDPLHAKRLAEGLNISLKRFEEQFGIIETPKALVAFEKQNKKFIEGLQKNQSADLGYLG